ncbi:MAG: hypothetical protein EBZ36_10325, partial [Acidobacteria bacterium]|nr:hypothetical protein [Acidobacteriota bacterium]
DGGTATISDLSGNDVLVVGSGAIANATVTAAYTAGAGTTNGGTANLTTNGFSVNLAGASTGNGFVVTNTGTGTTLTGSSGNDTLNGGGGDDTLQGGAGTNTINAGDGNDRIVMSGNYGDYDITCSGSNVVVTTKAGISPASIDTISQGEILQFADKSVYLVGCQVKEFPTATIAYGAPTTELVSGGTVQYLVTFDQIVTGGAISNFTLDDSIGVVEVNSTNETITKADHGLPNGTTVIFSASGGTIPGGITAGTVYYVREAMKNTFRIEATTGGSVVDITSNGTNVTARTLALPHQSATITGVSGSGTTRVVTISLGTTTGQVRLRLSNTTGIVNVDGQSVEPLPQVGPRYTRFIVVDDDADTGGGGGTGGGGTGGGTGGGGTGTPVTGDSNINVEVPLVNFNPTPVVATYTANIFSGLEATGACTATVNGVARGNCTITQPRRGPVGDNLTRRAMGPQSGDDHQIRFDTVDNNLSRTAGTLQVVQTLTWSGTLASGETVIIRYSVEVVANQPGSGLQITSAGQFVNPSTGAVLTTFPTINLNYTVRTAPPGPGDVIAGVMTVNGQYPGSVLIYNIYTSGVNTGQQDTRMELTNSNPVRSAYVHLFFVDGSSCTVADTIVEMTASQTVSFFASDIDPLVSGYMVAVAIDNTGCPISFNWLIGGAYVKFGSGHQANLAALGVMAAAGLPPCPSGAVTADLRFDGAGYEGLPRVLALSNLQPIAQGNNTMVIINRIGGNMMTGASRLGSLFGVLFDDQERPASFTAPGEACQLVRSISNGFPRVVPRLDQLVPSGRSGWMKFHVATGDQAITGAAINNSREVGGFNGGHNLHLLTKTTSAVLTIPIIPVE